MGVCDAARSGDDVCGANACDGFAVFTAVDCTFNVTVDWLGFVVELYT